MTVTKGQMQDNNRIFIREISLSLLPANSGITYNKEGIATININKKTEGGR
jgi:hypothetical protein